MEHPRGITKAARIHSHVDDLLLHGRRETGVGIHQNKHLSTPEAIRTAPIALLAFRRHARAHHIRALAVGTVEHVRDHRGSRSYRWFCFAQTPTKDRISTDLQPPQWRHATRRSKANAFDESVTFHLAAIP